MKALLQNPLFLRVASAVVLIPVVLWVITDVDKTGFYIMVAIGLALALWEWGNMVRYATHRVLRGLIGALYILICFAAFVYIHEEWEHPYTLSLMLAIWASDIGAYFAGKAIGGPKMAPAISPKKTWSGFIGGMIASGVMMCVFARYMAYDLFGLTGLRFFGVEDIGLDMPMPGWGLFVIGMGITVVGQAGDLLESWQKRTINIKDSGNLIPGHGGILDRIDSLLLAAPCYLILLEVLRHV